jgi:hypothetical protein
VLSVTLGRSGSEALSVQGPMLGAEATFQWKAISFVLDPSETNAVVGLDVEFGTVCLGIGLGSA